MGLSASSLFHFTAEKSSLFGILESNFKIRACKETVVFGKNDNRFHVPQVSFCDIPLSQIKDHITKYGNYGLGLRKEWGVANGLNPVLYLSKGSNVSLSYVKAVKHFVQGGKGNLAALSDEQKLLLDIVRYVKNYEGRLERKGQALERYRYSDEREWRYVPPIDSKCEMFAFEDWYKVAENAARMNAELEHLRLEFEPNDIKYIIIDNDDEISELIEHLKRAQGNKYSYADIERLTTRVLTCEQIMSDI